MNVRATNVYRIAFKTAAVLAPLLMALATYFAGDVQPIVRDVCGTLLPGELIGVPSAPR